MKPTIILYIYFEVHWSEGHWPLFHELLKRQYQLVYDIFVTQSVVNCQK